MPDAKSPDGLFRTPLECALLSGALSVAIDEATRHAPHETQWFNYRAFDFMSTFAITLALLSGPLIYERHRLSAVRWLWTALGITALMVVLRANFSFSWFGSSFSDQFWNGILVEDIVTKLLRASLVGYFLWMLYRARCSMAGCVGLAILGTLPEIALILQQYYLKRHQFYFQQSEPTREFAAFSFLLSILCTIAQVVLPTIPIDRALRRPKHVA